MRKRTTLNQIEDTPVSLRRTACCWPKCERQPQGETPLCSAHLHIAADLVDAEDPLWRHRHIARPSDDAPKVSLDGTVYMLRCGGYVKIGWTSDLANRMRAYQPDSQLLATMPGTRKDENRLHKRFAHLRTHGREWYSIAPQITEYAQILVAKHGQPDPVTFAAKPVTIPRTLGGRVERVL